MAQQNLRVKSGNRYLVQFDGKVVGLIQSIDARDEYGLVEASGVGDIHVQEWVPSMARHTLSVQDMVLNKNSLLASGINPENGDAVLKGIVFDIVAVSKDDGTVLRKYMGCSYASGSISIRKHAIIMSDATFNALDVSGVGG